MATIINTPGNNNGESTGAGMVIGAAIAILVVVVAIIYLIPYIRNQMNAGAPKDATIKVEIPVPSGSANNSNNPY